MSAEEFIILFQPTMMERPLEDGNSRGSLRGVRRDVESCGGRLTAKNRKRVGYQICSAAATRLAFSLSLSSGEVFFVKSGTHYRVVDGGELDLSTVHFRHDSSATNEEAVRMCRLKGTPNDRHQSGGR